MLNRRLCQVAIEQNEPLAKLVGVLKIFLNKFHVKINRETAILTRAYSGNMLFNQTTFCLKSIFKLPDLNRYLIRNYIFLSNAIV